MNSPGGPPQSWSLASLPNESLLPNSARLSLGFSGSLNLGFKRQIQVENVFPELRAQRLHPKASSIPLWPTWGVPSRFVYIRQWMEQPLSPASPTPLPPLNN